MTVFFIVLGVIAGLIVLLLIAALFVPKDYAIHREVTVDQPREAVFEYLRVLKNQEQWSVWVMRDPTMQKSFRGTDGQVGSVYAWNSAKGAGEGEQEIVGLKPNERLDIEIRFKRPMAMTAQTPLALANAGAGKTTVRFGMDGHSPYPMNLMTAMLSGGLGKDLQKSLNNLKAIFENR